MKIALLVLILNGSISIVPGWRPTAQCEAIGKAWVEQANRVRTSAQYVCVPFPEKDQ